METQQIREETPIEWHHLRRLRTRGLFPPSLTANLVDVATAALFPWSRKDYPGVMRLRAWLMGGIPVTSASAFRRVGPSKRVWLAMAQRLRVKACELVALAAKCEEEAGCIPEPFRFKSKPRPDVKPPE